MQNKSKEFIFSILHLIKQSKIVYLAFWFSTLMAFYRSGIYVAVVLCILLFPLVIKFEFYDKTFAWILLYSISMGLIGGIKQSIPGGGTDIIFIIFSPPLFYLLGRSIVCKSISTDEITLFLLITIICFGGLLYKTILLDIYYNGFINPIREITIGNADRPATHYGTIASLGLVGLGYFFISNKSNNYIVPLLFICCSVLSITTVLHLINRTGLVVVVVSTIIMCLYYYRHHNTKFVIVFLLISIIVYIVIISNTSIASDLFEVYENRNSYDAGTMGSRTILWRDAINNILKYPWGWSRSVIEMKHSLVHNFWLDNARIAGVFPLLFSILCLFSPIRHLIKMLQIQKDSYVSLVLGVFTIMFLSLFVEPQLDASPYYVSLFFMLLGIINGSYFKYYRYKLKHN